MITILKNVFHSINSKKCIECGSLINLNRLKGKLIDKEDHPCMCYSNDEKESILKIYFKTILDLVFLNFLMFSVALILVGLTLVSLILTFKIYSLII